MFIITTPAGRRTAGPSIGLGCTQGDRLLTVEDLSEWLGVPVATVYAWQYRRSGPPSYKVGRHLRYRRSDVEAWLETLRTEPSAPDLLRGLLGAKPVRTPVPDPARPRVAAEPGFTPPPITPKCHAAYGDCRPRCAGRKSPTSPPQHAEWPKSGIGDGEKGSETSDLVGGAMTTVTGAGKAARRRDAGVPRLTERDLWALTWVGEQYGMRVDQLARLLGRRAEGTTNRNGILTGRRVRKVVERWERAGLVQARKVFHTDPMWVWLTRAGLRAVDLEAKFLEPSAMLLRHIFWCAEVRLRLDADYDDLIWRSDRILKAFGTGRTDQHLADAETKFDGTVRAIEVELTPKTWMRTKEIMDILAGAYPEVWYYVAPPAADLVRHIVGDLKPEHQAKFRVIDLATLTPGHPR